MARDAAPDFADLRRGKLTQACRESTASHVKPMELRSHQVDVLNSAPPWRKLRPLPVICTLVGAALYTFYAAGVGGQQQAVQRLGPWRGPRPGAVWAHALAAAGPCRLRPSGRVAWKCGQVEAGALEPRAGGPFAEARDHSAHGPQPSQGVGGVSAVRARLAAPWRCCSAWPTLLVTSVTKTCSSRRVHGGKTYARCCRSP